MCSHEVDWMDQLSGVNATLCRHSVTANHSSSEVQGFICAFYIDESNEHEIESDVFYGSFLETEDSKDD